MDMQTWKKIKRMGITGILFLLLFGIYGCQQAASDAVQSKDTQIEKQEMRDKENTVASGSEEDGKEQARKTAEEYITPEDVTEEELFTKNEAVQENTGKEPGKHASDNQTDHSEKHNTADKDASLSHGDKNKTKDKKETSSYKENHTSSNSDKAFSNDNAQKTPAVVEKSSPANAKDTSVNQSGETYCSLTIECKDVLNHKDKLKKNKKSLIPENGIIYSNANTIFSDGESVFDILLRVTKNNKIQMEYNYTPAFQSNYIEGIANLYEFDCGETSGWGYTVNGQSPNYGCNRYTVNAGDEIIWRYTCGN